MAFINLLDQNGGVPSRSGLNWGLNSNELLGNVHTRVADAELRITADLIRNNPHLIPTKNDTRNIIVPILWDDDTQMSGSFEQNIQINGITYPKALCSANDKSILGSYLRHRLGVNLTTQITLRDLERYGRTDIEISMLPTGVYYLNFSVYP